MVTALVVPVALAAHGLGLHVHTVWQWLHDHATDSQHASPGEGLHKPAALPLTSCDHQRRDRTARVACYGTVTHRNPVISSFSRAAVMWL